MNNESHTKREHNKGGDNKTSEEESGEAYGESERWGGWGGRERGARKRQVAGKPKQRDRARKV